MVLLVFMFASLLIVVAVCLDRQGLSRIEHLVGNKGPEKVKDFRPSLWNLLAPKSVGANQ